MENLDRSTKLYHVTQKMYHDERNRGWYLQYVGLFKLNTVSQYHFHVGECNE